VLSLPAKEFIDAELAKYETWDLAPLFIKELIGAEPAYRNVKARGSGGETILRFLGGNWKQWMIQEGHKKTPAHYRPGFSCRIL
jgi:hypothetical protein